MKERGLWASVLLQALNDANYPMSRARETRRGPTGKCHGNDIIPTGVEIGRARGWLKQNSKDLRIVCAFAGMDYRKILLRAELQSARQWDQEKIPLYRKRGRPVKHSMYGGGSHGPAA